MTLRRQVKRAAASIGAAAISSTGRRVVLCYHSISPTAPYRDLTTAAFAQHLDFLTAHTDVRPLAELLADAAAGRTGSRPQVALTFDDGFADNASVVRPALRDRALPAAFFVPTGFVDGDPVVTGHMARMHGLAPTDVAALDWDDVGALVADGHLIGSHTYGHRNLVRLGPTELADELGRSRERLVEQVGPQASVLAYPYGKPGAHTTADIRSAAAASGYDYGLSVTFRGLPAALDPMDVPRFTLPGTSVAELEQRVRGALDLVGAWQQRAPLWVRRIVSPEDFGYS